MAIVCPADPTATQGRINQYRDYYQVKYEIAAERAVSMIVEIGVRAGYSAWAFLQAHPEARYRGYDNGSTRHGGFAGALTWAENILRPYDATIVRCDTQQVDVLPGLDANQADLFHVDGDHSKAGVMHDLDLAYYHTRPGGMILLDDVSHIEGVRHAANDWQNKMGLSVLAEFRPSLRGELLMVKQ